jgi:hypothetical protein
VKVSQPSEWQERYRQFSGQQNDLLPERQTLAVPT